MQALAGPFVSALLGALASAVGVYVAVTNRLTRTETLIEVLAEKVERHNNLVERMAIVEQDNRSQWARIDELRGHVDRLEQR